MTAFAPELKRMVRLLTRYSTWLLLALTLGLALGGGVGLARSVSLPAADEFNGISWELRHVPNKWLYLTGRLFRGRLSPAQEQHELSRYLDLTASIQGQERSGDADPPELARLRKERDHLENDVEAIIEGRLTALLEDQGLESSLPLFPQARWVFPPVDVEFEAPPREVAVSPRDRIELVATRPLPPGLTRERAIAVEQAIERDGLHSALVFSLAGVATYPSIVGPQSDYQALIETVAHEWVHQYLAFKPLGVRFYDSLELRTLNESVADLAGKELAELFVQRYPLAAPADPQTATVPAADVDAVLHRLRLDVDALLAQGKVAEAEALMEQRRQELAAQGVVYRRINQAFFAFNGLYATDPAAVDPIGGKVQELRAETGSVGAFLRSAAGLTSEGDLDRRLADGATP